MTKPARKADQTAAGPASPPKRSRIYVQAVALALAGTLLTSLIEFVALLWQPPEGELPAAVYLGIFGKIVLTHACIVLPVLLVLSLAVSAIIARRPGRRPEGWHMGVFVLVAGTLVIYADLVQVRSLRYWEWKYAFPVVPLILAVVCIIVVGWLCRTRFARWYHGALGATAMVGIVVLIAAPFLIRGTPLAGPNAYWLSAATDADVEPRTQRRSTTEPAGPPNVLFIVLDTARADRLSFYGYGARDTSPFLAELADKSIVFDRALAPGIWTLPTHASMFTGLSIREHGTTHRHKWLEDRFETVAERADSLGYQTVAFTNNPFIGHGFNTSQGFAEFHPVWCTRKLYSTFADYWLSWLGAPPPTEWFEHDNGSSMTIYLINRWLDRGRDWPRPYFMFINYGEAHMDYLPPRAYREKYMDAASHRRSWQLNHRYGRMLMGAGGIRYALDPDYMPDSDVQVYRSLYDLAIRYLDDRLRELFVLLERRGMLDNTVVIITSDHGESLGEDGTWQHSLLIHDVLLHVPLLVYLPGAESIGQRVPQPVSAAGIFDAICASLGAEQRPDGQILVKAITEYRGGGPVVSELPVLWPACERLGTAHGWVMHQHRLLRTFRAVCESKWKYTKASDGAEGLYDIEADPYETYNILNTEPQVAASLRGFLAAWLEKTRPYVPGGGPEGQPSDEELQQIKALGYVGS